MGRLVTQAGLVADLRRAMTRRGRRRLGHYLIEGTRLHERALRAGVVPPHVLVSDRYGLAADSRQADLLHGLRNAGCEPTTAPDSVVAQLIEGRDSGRIVGLVPFPQQPTIDKLCGTDTTVRLLVAAEIEDPGNVGALVRTAHASGASGLIGLGVTDPFHPKAVRTSMGSLFRLPIMVFDGAAAALARQLSRHRVRRLGAVSRHGTSIRDAPHERRRFALYVGSEAHGLSESVLETLDEHVTIPMPDDVDSFSVNAATAILLWELAATGRR